MDFIKHDKSGSGQFGKSVLMTDSGIDLQLDANLPCLGEDSSATGKRLESAHVFHKKENFFGYFSHSITEKALFYSVTIIGLILLFGAILRGLMK